MASFLKFYNTYLEPTTDNTLDLGTISNQFKDLWLNGKAYIDGFGQDMLVDTSFQLQFRDTNVYIYCGTDGHLDLVADVSVDINSTLSIDAQNISTDTSTGTKIGTATDQKLSFFNSTPIVQPLATTDLGTVLSDLGLRVIGTAYPITTSGAVALSGTVTSTGGWVGKITTITDTYQVLVTDQTIICDKTTAFTVTLPTAVVGQKFNIKNINTGTVTLEGDGADTIDGDLNQAIYQWECVQVQCYAANKWGLL